METKKLKIYLRRVVGKSMLPSFKEGNVLLFFGRKKYKTGDVVLANIKGRDIIKRVYSISNGQYDLRGDNTDASTDSRNFGLVSRDNILGKVIIKL